MGRIIERHLLELMTPVSDARAHNINTLREVAQAFNGQDYDRALALLESLEAESADGLPTPGHLAEVAVQSLDAWYSKEGVRNGNIRIIQRDVPRSVRKLTPDLEALARKGRAHRSIGSLLRRNPQHLVAGAGAYMVSAIVAALAAHRDATFESVLDELLPEQQVSQPVQAPVAKSAEAPVAKQPVGKAPQDATSTEANDETTSDTKRYKAIVETRFLAGVKELQHWVGESHPVTGTGLPKRADIKDVAATIGITAEGVAKKQEPEPAPASDTDLSIAAQPQPTRYVQSAQAIPEVMAFLAALQECGVIEVGSTKVQPGAGDQDFGFENVDQLDAAEQLVATYVRETLTYATQGDSAAQTAKFALDAADSETPASADAEEILIPRLRQLEAMELIEIDDGILTIPAPLATAVRNGLEQASQYTA